MKNNRCSLKKRVPGQVQGDKFLNIILKALLQVWFQIATVFLPSFFSPFSSALLGRRVSPIIQPPLSYLDPKLVDHLNPYLSTCLIKHPLWISVSCDCQGSTVQGSSPHKCSQKSSCSAFNAVVVAFPQIFFGVSFSLVRFWGTSLSLRLPGRSP